MRREPIGEGSVMAFGDRHNLIRGSLMMGSGEMVLIMMGFDERGGPTRGSLLGFGERDCLIRGSLMMLLARGVV